MDATAARPPVKTKRRSTYYLGSLDGLRFLAFLPVFMNHMPLPAAMLVFSQRGWIGADMFFVLSAFLLFHLLEAEWRKDGQISVRNFYFRRVLRIYPLLIVYYTVMFIYSGGYESAIAWARFALQLGSLETLGIWLWGWNFSVKAVGPLWTLSFEFQVYLLLPLAFLAWKKWGTRRFLLGLLVIEALAFLGRYLVVQNGATWEHAFSTLPLHPEDVLLGIALVVLPPKWRPEWSLAIAVCAGFVHFVLPRMDTLWAFFPAAIFAAALMDAGLRFGPLRAVFSTWPMRKLGMISYGIYMFHLVSIWGTYKVLTALGLLIAPLQFGTALATAIILGALSYRFIEGPFLKMKLRYTSVDGRGEEGELHMHVPTRSPEAPAPDRRDQP